MLGNGDTVWIVLEKTRETGMILVQGVYDSFDLAEEVVEELMDIFGEDRAYKIESKSLVVER